MDNIPCPHSNAASRILTIPFGFYVNEVMKTAFFSFSDFRKGNHQLLWKINRDEVHDYFSKTQLGCLLTEAVKTTEIYVWSTHVCYSVTGIQRPLKDINEMTESIYIPKGVNMPALDRKMHWEFKPNTNIRVGSVIMHSETYYVNSSNWN